MIRMLLLKFVVPYLQTRLTEVEANWLVVALGGVPKNICLVVVADNGAHINLTLDSIKPWPKKILLLATNGSSMNVAPSLESLIKKIEEARDENP